MRILTHVCKANALCPSRQIALSRQGELAVFAVGPDLIRQAIACLSILTRQEQVGQAITVQVDERVKVRIWKLAIEGAFKGQIGAENRVDVSGKVH